MYLKCTLLLALSTMATINSMITETVRVGVYYEAHCPCSTNFIKKQLYPNYFKLDNRLIIDLVPYGDTHAIFENGTTTFKCKDDASDCYALKVHACAVAESNPTNVTLEFLNCIIDTQYTPDEIQICASNFSVSWNNITECLSSNISNILLSDFGNRTKIIHPTDIPAIVFDDKYVEHISEKAKENFLQAVCAKFIIDIPKPCEDFTHVSSLLENALK